MKYNGGNYNLIIKLKRDQKMGSDRASSEGESSEPLGPQLLPTVAVP
mgnify:FL=1